MTRMQVTQMLTILKTAYPRFYSKVTKSEAENTINLWYAMFKDEEAYIVTMAIYNLIKKHKDFPPEPAHVQEEIDNIIAVSTGEPMDTELWNIYKNAVARGVHRDRAKYDQLPELIKIWTGSPATMYEHGMTDEKDFISFVRTQFMKEIPIIRARERDRKRLPDSIKGYINLIADKFSLKSDEPRYLTDSEINDRRNMLLDQLENYKPN